jgi:hypothetical protein
MAARTNLRQQEQTRAAIQTSQLVNRLQRFALADPDVEIDAGRLKAIEVLLRKTLPDLSAVSHSGDEENPVVVTEIKRSIVDPRNTDSPSVPPAA